MSGFRWLKPDVYPLLAAMGFASGLCVFQLARNVVLNPDVRIMKSQRTTAILDNAEKAQQYHNHAVRDFLLSRGPLREIIAEARAEK
ncbi:uncharacterized protein LOC144552019 [Carex rostrata]